MKWSLSLIALPYILFTLASPAWSKHHELPFQETMAVKPVTMKAALPENLSALYEKTKNEDRSVASIKEEESL